ncbi:hypothetical protein [Saccharomonospora halophila]|uniref:hypothetical protein n=1 Tax=Saccharomonospora halophila TaxID=129922 RepID=UPI00037F1864|nr:hypothetical protein [Saccharomonospora halophila]
MRLPEHLALLVAAETALADAFTEVADGHAAEPDVATLGSRFADLGRAHVRRLEPVVAHYGEAALGTSPVVSTPGAELPAGPRGAGAGLVWDLQNLVVRAALVEITWTAVGQAAQALRDRELLCITGSCVADTRSAVAWLRTRIEQAAPQALIAAA